MSDKLQVVITGSNGVSRVFQEITRDAQAMGTGIEQSSEKSNASMEKVGQAIGAAGLAFGAFTLLATKASGDSEASAARLETSFHNAGLAVEDYQGQINQLNSTGLHLGFDDEDVQDALAGLLTVTNDVQKSISDVGLAEDIARAKGISLASATQIVVAAENGRFRGLAALGVAIDATSTKESVLADAQAKFAGQSAAYAETGAATFDRWKNTAENALESVGSHLTSLQVPILALSSAATAMGPLSSVLKDIGGASVIADVAMGPAGLAAAAIAAGAGLLYLATQSDHYVTAAQTAIGVTDDLTNMLVQLEANASPRNKLIFDSLEKQVTAFVDYAGTAQDRLTGLSELASRLGQGANSLDLLNATQLESAEAITHMTEAQLTALDVNSDNIVTYQEMKDAIAGVIPEVQGLAGIAQALNADQLKKFGDDFTAFMTLPNLDVSKAADAVNELITEFQSGALTADQFIAGMDDLLVHTKPYIQVTHDSTAAIAGQTAAIADASQVVWTQMAAYGQSQAVIRQDTEARKANAAAIAAQMAAYGAQNPNVGKVSLGDQITSAVQYSNALAHVADISNQLAPATDNASHAVAGLTGAMDDQIKKTEDIQKALLDYQKQLGQTAAVASDHAGTFSQHAQTAGNALSSGFNVAVGGSNAMGQASQQTADWAKELIGVAGTTAKIDDLLARGVINQQEYNAAQAAGTSIFAANAAIQDDILKIQTDQAPLLAELDANQQRYVDHLAELPPQQQLVRLGYMDSAEAAKALQAQQLAAAAAAGELGAAGEESATKMITGAAEADPVLQALLTDMGLISVGADGTITVNYDSVKDAHSETKDLTDAIDRLDADLQKIFGITVDSSSAVTAKGDVDGVGSSLNSLDGSSATVSVGANTDAASSALAFMQSQLDALDGRVVTFYTQAQSSGAIFSPGTSSTTGAATSTGSQGTGGWVPAAHGYAGSGDFIAGEFGPELIHRSGGGAFVLPTGATKSHLTGGGPSNYFDFRGATFGTNREEIVTAVSDAMVIAAKRHFRAHGVTG